MSTALSVIGFGAVGRTLTKQAVEAGVKVFAVADSSCAFVATSESGLSEQHLNTLDGLKKNRQPLSQWTGDGAKKVDVKDLANELPRGSVLADCSATDNTTEVLLAAQQNGIPVVLANKKPLTASMAVFDQLTADRSMIRFESTVGAGLPVISSLRRLLDSGDKMTKVEGQLSGTLGYILSELQLNKPFSQVVRTAKELGFTEPDPRDDLSGTDVARKSLILARCMGSRMELSDIDIEPLYPADMADLSVEEFMDKLETLDESIGQRVADAMSRGNKLRYAAVVEPSGIKVGLIEVGPENALSNLVGTDNLVSMGSEWYASPLVVSGPGAGLEVTAAGVLSDAFDLQGVNLKKKWGL